MPYCSRIYLSSDQAQLVHTKKRPCFWFASATGPYADCSSLLSDLKHHPPLPSCLFGNTLSPLFSRNRFFVDQWRTRGTLPYIPASQRQSPLKCLYYGPHFVVMTQAYFFRTIMLLKTARKQKLDFGLYFICRVAPPIGRNTAEGTVTVSVG